MGASFGVIYVTFLLAGIQLLTPVTPVPTELAIARQKVGNSSKLTGISTDFGISTGFGIRLYLRQFSARKLQTASTFQMNAYKPPNNGGPKRGSKGTGTRFQALAVENLLDA